MPNTFRLYSHTSRMNSSSGTGISMNSSKDSTISIWLSSNRSCGSPESVKTQAADRRTNSPRKKNSIGESSAFLTCCQSDMTNMHMPDMAVITQNKKAHRLSASMPSAISPAVVRYPCCNTAFPVFSVLIRCISSSCPPLPAGKPDVAADACLHKIRRILIHSIFIKGLPIQRHFYLLIYVWQYKNRIVLSIIGQSIIKITFLTFCTVRI